jgi:hypothetical protein
MKCSEIKYDSSIPAVKPLPSVAPGNKLSWPVEELSSSTASLKEGRKQTATWKKPANRPNPNVTTEPSTPVTTSLEVKPAQWSRKAKAPTSEEEVLQVVSVDPEQSKAAKTTRKVPTFKKRGSVEDKLDGL